MPEQQTRVLAGRYELITPLGRGTMGTVWRAYDRSLGREVAIKEIRQEPGLSEAQRTELRERMIREGRTAARISHPSVATVHDAIIEDGSPWIIMELVQARSLEQVVEEEGPLPPRLVAAIGVDLLDALRAAHAQGILHRDVKPGNVLITESGRVVLTDFGIAKAEGDTSLTQTGMVIGSPGYTAPERARGEHTGPESDLWSLGATLYFAVEGRPAYERSTMAETLAALMTESVDPPVQAGPLRPLLEQLLQKDHTARLTASQAIAMLRAVADTPLSASQEFPVPPGAAARSAAAEPAPAHRPGSGASGGGAGTEEEFDANRTMIVARPTMGRPLPRTGASPAAPAEPRPEAASASGTDLGTPVARGPVPPRQSGQGQGQSAAQPGQPWDSPAASELGRRVAGAPQSPEGAGSPPRRDPGRPSPDETATQIGALPGHGGPGPRPGPGGPPPGGFPGPGGPGAPEAFHGAGGGPGGFPNPGGPGPHPGPGGPPPGPFPGPGGPGGPEAFHGAGGGPGGFPNPGGYDHNQPGGPGGLHLPPPGSQPGLPGGPGPFPPGAVPGDDQDRPGLGTELFAVVGPNEPPPVQQRKRTSALVWMGVATAALVFLIVLVLAILSA
ncbi:protein kinase [Planomonospora corallina]|uniref:non-specific serine/threonine protein kinase n=1 Tax=Planomonospora corallina TaxID=1806052 RepID=A0ABV8I2G2_9ACTN